MIEVMIADDQELMRDSLHILLSTKADIHICSLVKNGKEVLAQIPETKPDVILMDIMMPVMNGYEAAKMIRTLDRDDAKTVPIIAMTANAFTEDRLKSKESGMNEHIAKPIDAKLLVKVISEFVENKEEDS